MNIPLSYINNLTYVGDLYQNNISFHTKRKFSDNKMRGGKQFCIFVGEISFRSSLEFPFGAPEHVSNHERRERCVNFNTFGDGGQERSD